MSKISRSFKITDAELIEHADVVALTLPSDLPSFTAFDSTINPAFIAALIETTALSNGFITDEVMIDEQAEQTFLRNRALNACYKDYQTIAYFARKAFGNNPAILNQFGVNDIRKARSSQSKMLVFMESLVQTATQYEAELVAAGCDRSLIEGLSAKTLAFHDASLQQEKFKKERKLNTQNRILTLIEVYRLLQALYKASFIVFKNDPARRRIYTMPQPTPPPAKPPVSPIDSDPE